MDPPLPLENPIDTELKEKAKQGRQLVVPCMPVSACAIASGDTGKIKSDQRGCPRPVVSVSRARDERKRPLHDVHHDGGPHEGFSCLHVLGMELC